MAGFGRDMGGKRVGEAGRVQFRQRCGGRGADEAVEQHRHAQAAGGQGRAEDGGEFTPAERRCDLQRIGECLGVCASGRLRLR